MDNRKSDLLESSIKGRDNQGSPVALLGLALASGIGFISWKLWQQWQEERKDIRDTGSREGSQTTAKNTSKVSSTFDKQPKPAVSTSGRRATAASSSSYHWSSRQEPQPKSQKQLRKEAKQAKKAAREQAARNAESADVAAAIAKRARDLGLGTQTPETQRHYYVDYEGVTKAHDKIVEWQQTGKKTY